MIQYDDKHFDKNLSPIFFSVSEYRSVTEIENSSENQSINDFVELSIVIKGNGTHNILNKTTECQVGDLFILSNGISHSYYALDNNNYPTVLKICFNPKEILSGKYSDPTSQHYCYGVFRDNLPVSYALLNSNSLVELNRICDLLETELNNNYFEGYEAARAHLMLLLISLARYINLADTVQPNFSKDWLIVSAAIREISERCTDVDMTLGSIADSLYISKSHLSRLFQKVTGESFLEYARKIRINKACEYLKDTSFTNEEIVRKCGLKDIPSFYRQFKSVTGMTPHQYRKSNNSNFISEYIIEEEILNEISDSLKNGRYTLTQRQIDKALNSGIDAEKILNLGLLRGMNTVANQFKNNEIFVPTVLAAAKAMNIGIDALKPYLVENESNYIGTVCIGTVRGDLHDIGKNLVKILMESKKLKVIDLGIDVAPEEFINTAIEHNCKVICCSALLTTTMGVMKEIVDLATQSGIRDKVKILIGGAPLSEEFCNSIGADLYTPDASSAAEAAVKFCR